MAEGSTWFNRPWEDRRPRRKWAGAPQGGWAEEWPGDRHWTWGQGNHSSNVCWEQDRRPDAGHPGQTWARPRPSRRADFQSKELTGPPRNSPSVRLSNPSALPGMGAASPSGFSWEKNPITGAPWLHDHHSSWDNFTCRTGWATGSRYVVRHYSGCFCDSVLLDEMNI